VRAAAAAGLLAALQAGTAAASVCSPAVLDLRWDGAAARFRVEIADDAEERARGLMHRRELARGTGMLFVYPRPGPVSFWMKNTLIPLDMIFIGPDGRVNGIHAMAVPGDTTPIPGPPGTQFVLEIGGGLAGRLGLAEGAEVRHPAVDQDIALWPC